MRGTHEDTNCCAGEPVVTFNKENGRIRRMSGFDEYYNLPELPDALLKALQDLEAKFKKKYEDWQGIEVEKDQWPEGNTIRLFYGDMALNDISEISEAIEALLKAHNLSFEVSSSGFTHTEDG